MVTLPALVSSSSSLTPYGTPEGSPCPSLSASAHSLTDSCDPPNPWGDHETLLAYLRTKLPNLSNDCAMTEEQFLDLQQKPDDLNALLLKTWEAAQKIQERHMKGDDYVRISSWPRGADRYGNVLPYTYNHLHTGRDHSPYINGSRVLLGDKTQLKLLLTQGPTDQEWVKRNPNFRRETVGDFWHLVFKEQPKWVVSLTKAREDVGEDPQTKKRKFVNKCADYWTSDSVSLDDSSSIHKMEGQTGFSMDSDPDKLQISAFQARNSAGEVVYKFHHALYKAWPDHGVPVESDRRILAKLGLRILDDAGDNPILVHCSAGIGRTGTFVLFLHLLRELKEGRSIDPLRALIELRMQRNGCVQSEKQWKTVFLLLSDALQLLATQSREQGPVGP